MNHYLINLKRRPDRLAQSLREWDNTGLPKPIIFEAVDGTQVEPPEGWRAPREANGCRLSHISILQKELANDQVAIFEDDCLFVHDFPERYQELMDSLPDDWDAVFFGGQHVDKPLHTPIPNLVRAQNCHRTHGYMIRGKYMKHMLDVWSNCKTHLDFVWGMFHQKSWNVYCPTQWLCGQFPSKSDITGRQCGLRMWQTHTTGKGRPRRKAQ
jgi:GR25 family glycosyltransferase involved in LPS biosynthesis